MNEDIKITVPVNKLKENEICIIFNEYRTLIDIDFFRIFLESENCEVYPGVFIESRTFIPNCFIITIFNFRDKIKVLLGKDDSAEVLYFDEGTRKIKVIPEANENLKNHYVKLDSIHYPNHEIGGFSERCCIKGIMHAMHLYPELYSIDYIAKSSNKNPYYLFNFEEVFALPDYISELNKECKKFCGKRNSENRSFDIGADINNLDNLINSHIVDSIKLVYLPDKTVKINNGNHRICFLKHFGKNFGIYKLSVNNLHKSFLQKDNQEFGYYSSAWKGSNDQLDTESFYTQLNIHGITREEAKMILREGMNCAELYMYLKEKNALYPTKEEKST